LTAILLLLLLPMPSVAMAHAAMSAHGCCDGKPAMSMTQDAVEGCPEPAGARSDVPACGADTTKGVHPDPGTCPECLGVAGPSLALHQRVFQSVPSSASDATVPARPVFLPTPPPSRLERPPRVFSS
jgi:hypothetical protein